MNWDAVGREVVDLLVEYLRIDTTNPPGNERQAVEFLGRFLEKEGLEVHRVGKEPDRQNLICRVSSAGERRGLMLLHHCDVVAANAEEWSVPPFGGLIKDGYLWGRGALDMKGLGIMEVMALVLAQRERMRLARDLLLVVTCDEESGSGLGAAYLAEHHPRELEAAWCLNEGGWGWRQGEFVAIMGGFGEKGPLWVRLTAEGRSGHASLPHGENPCEHLTGALESLLKLPRPLRVLPELRTLLERLGLGGLSAEELSSHPLLQIPSFRAMFQDTMSLTGLKAGSRVNVIPDRAEATLDLRLLPGRTTQEALQALRQALPSGPLRMEPILTTEASSSPVDTAFFQCMERMAEKFFPGIPFVPSIAPYFTDSRCLRPLGIHCYGWMPILLEQEELSRMHGKDERIKVEDLGLGTRVIFEMIRELCGRP
jgi:acetylornithine deacetylase/succinyl-diaminopimelate desuccinylase-like protein